MPLPPLPPGFSLQSGAPRRRDPNLLKPLLDAGVTATNGYRTLGDVHRLQAEGYHPAPHSLHLNGDAVDLTPGKSGLTLQQLQAKATSIATATPGGKVLNEGDHVHVQIPGWGMAPGTPGTPNSGLPPLPAGARLLQRGSLQSSGGPHPSATSALNSSTALTPAHLTGQAHDGDTVRLDSGKNGRLFGFDAFELAQQGRRADGTLVPLGQQARASLRSLIAPGQPATPTGAETYGRQVVTLGDLNNDPARNVLRMGLGQAEPDYLKGSPQFGPYMEAERLARLNRLGGFATNAETPSQFRHKNGPWQGATPAPYGQGQATFFDERSPLYGLRPELAQQYRDAALKAKTPEEIVSAAQSVGATVPLDAAKEWMAQRAKAGGSVAPGVQYLTPPRPVIDPGDGRFGTTMRGVGDAFNVLDELGGVIDTVGGTGGRENVFNSDRRFGDILWNNIDQNRAIIEHDDATHPNYRLGGQIAGSLAIPLAGEMNIPRLAAVGAAEGGLAGFGAGEGGIVQRLPNAILGAGGGAVLGPALGLASEHLIAPLARRGAVAFNRALGRGESAADAGALGVNESLPSAPRSAAMAAEQGSELVGPVAGRQRDVININDLPPLPEGFSLHQPFGVTRQMGERLSPEETARLAEGVDPRGAVPRPATQIEGPEDAAKIGAGRFAELQPPNEFDHLPVRTVTTATGGKMKVRGPLDMTQALRLMGGVKDEGGNLAHLGITNAPRRMDFGSNEQFLGKLINNDTGRSLDDATHALWEKGYFPEFKERPTPDDLLDRLHSESTGAQRYFHPDTFEEVAQFHSAQAERFSLEAAKADGRPLFEERGHSINIDDLAANTPPASAYEDTPRLTGKIGNINLDRLEKPGDVAALIDQVSRRVGGFSAAARGKVTHEETQRLALEMGVKPEQLLKRQQGQALNAEQLYASRALVQRSRETVARLAKKAVGGSDDDLATFRKAWLKHAALEEQIAGATAEAGRALQQFRMLANAQDAGANAVRAYLKGAGGKESIEDAASAIVVMEDPAKASHFMREAVKPRWRDKFNELWVNSLLSGPRTHVVNFVGNALTTALALPELATTAALGKLTRSSDRAMFGEIGARAAGLGDSSVEALRAMRTAFKTGEPLDQSAKVEAFHHQAIGGKFGQIIRTPTRALTAADEFWKTLLTNAELRQMAYRQAKFAAKSPEDFRARYEALVRAPSDEMLKAAHEQARYYTFQKELGPVGRGVQQISNNSIVGKILLPFVRTPSNIIKFAGERSAFGLAMPEVRQALRAGGRARDEALAKITLGSGLSTAAVVAALDGRISGSGPTDPSERAALLQSGWQPNSIRIGDKWVSYSRFDPVSTLIGVAADFAEAGKWATNKEADQIALNVAMSIAKNITNKTWLSGLSDAFDVLSDPERYGKGYVRKLAASMAVPALLSQTAQSLDPNLRDARSIMDAIKVRVPILSNSVPVRRNVWGEPVSNGDAIGPDIVSPFYASKINKEPLSQEIARLRAPLSMPQRSIMVQGKRIPLDAQQYGELVQLSGQPAKQALTQALKSPEWKAMGDEDRRQFVKDTLENFRDTAREELLNRHPELAGGAIQFRPQAADSPIPFGQRSLAVPRLPPGFRRVQ
jgi:endonuclease YncB( thermonuclease family)